MSSPSFPDVADTCAGYPNGPMFMNFMCNALNDSDIYMFTLDQSSAMRQAYNNSHSSLKISHVGTVTSIQTNDKNTLNYSVFPNPTNGFIQIKSNVRSDKMLIKILSITGEIINQQEVTNFIGSFSIDLSKQTKGIYFIELRSDGKTSVQKIIVQ